MANGWFDETAVGSGWFDANASAEGWFDDDLLKEAEPSGAITGLASAAQAQATVATGSSALQVISGNGSTNQAQKSAATGSVAGLGISGSAATSQTQASNATGSSTLPATTGAASTAQAQRSAATGASAPQTITGGGATSQAQSTVASGNSGAQAISGSASTRQAQTALATGTVLQQGVTGAAASSQSQSTSANGDVSENITEQPRGGTGNDYLRQKLLRSFDDEEQRLKSLENLPKIAPAQRTAIKTAARRLASSIEEFSYDDVEQQIKASLYPIGAAPEPLHVDWVMYFLRVEAYHAEQANAQEEAEIAMALMMAKRKMHTV